MHTHRPPALQRKRAAEETKFPGSGWFCGLLCRTQEFPSQTEEGKEGDELGEAGREVHGWQVSWEEPTHLWNRGWSLTPMLSLHVFPTSPGPGFSTLQLCSETPWWSLGGARTLMNSAVMFCSTRSTATPGSCLPSPVSPYSWEADIHLQPSLSGDPDPH